MTDSKCREGPGKEVAVVAKVATGARGLGSLGGKEQGRDRWGLFDISIVAPSKSAPY